jgi:hypothetical protein
MWLGFIENFWLSLKEGFSIGIELVLIEGFWLGLDEVFYDGF